MHRIERQFIRHPSDIPIEYSITNTPPEYCMETLSNVSEGGLRFHAKHPISTELWVHILIPISEYYFEADAKVCWCKACTDTNGEVGYDVGVSFRAGHDTFSARMVEQICYIEQYKKKIKQQEGRELNSDQAAAEWITKYADDFPLTTQ